MKRKERVQRTREERGQIVVTDRDAFSYASIKEERKKFIHHKSRKIVLRVHPRCSHFEKRGNAFYYVHTYRIIVRPLLLAEQIGEQERIGRESQKY